jgi:hypothetical protein
MQLLEIRVCSDSCQFCTTLEHLHTSENVVKYMGSDEYKDREISVDSAQCDQIQGWGNFTSNVFGFDQNVCKCHSLGDDVTFRHLFASTISDILM